METEPDDPRWLLTFSICGTHLPGSENVYLFPATAAGRFLKSGSKGVDSVPQLLGPERFAQARRLD